MQDTKILWFTQVHYNMSHGHRGKPLDRLKSHNQCTAITQTPHISCNLKQSFFLFHAQNKASPAISWTVEVNHMMNNQPQTCCLLTSEDKLTTLVCIKITVFYITTQIKDKQRERGQNFAYTHHVILLNTQPTDVFLLVYGISVGPNTTSLNL